MPSRTTSEPRPEHPRSRVATRPQQHVKEEDFTLTRTIAPSQFKLPAEGVDLEEVERQLLTQALERAGGNQTQAGHLLGINRPGAVRMEKFGLAKP